MIIQPLSADTPLPEIEQSSILLIVEILKCFLAFCSSSAIILFSFEFSRLSSCLAVINFTIRIRNHLRLALFPILLAICRATYRKSSLRQPGSPPQPNSPSYHTCATISSAALWNTPLLSTLSLTPTCRHRRLISDNSGISASA